MNRRNLLTFLAGLPVLPSLLGKLFDTEKGSNPPAANPSIQKTCSTHPTAEDALRFIRSELTQRYGPLNEQDYFMIVGGGLTDSWHLQGITTNNNQHYERQSFRVGGFECFANRHALIKRNLAVMHYRSDNRLIAEITARPDPFFGMTALGLDSPVDVEFYG